MIGLGSVMLVVSALYWWQEWRYGLFVLIWGVTLGLMLLGPGVTLRWMERSSACLAGSSLSLLSVAFLLWWTRTVGDVGVWLWICGAIDLGGVVLGIRSYGRHRRR
jgi:hypothetical protein